MTLELPAWSEPFQGPDRSGLARTPALGRLRREVAFGSATGRGQLVAVVDSGVEADHPALGGRLQESVAVELRDGVPIVIDAGREGDLVGHGTACAGIIHSLAPEAELISVRVLGPDNRGRGPALAAGIAWAIEAGASVVSVAAHDVGDPAVWFHNPKPPVEFAAHGLDVEVAWRGGSRIVATGNSFAAPHIAGYATLIRAAHAQVMPFEVKTILAATADNATDTSA